MDAPQLYRPEVLREKVPTLHPRYQWMDIELEPDDRVVLTTINGHATVETVTELSELPQESVARVILKLVGRGVVLFDDDLPFYDEELVLGLVPAFDPTDTNRDANLDDSDRMLLTLINGRTSVGQMEAALPLSRERLIASVIRLGLAKVISFEEPPEPRTAPVRPAASSAEPAPERSAEPRPREAPARVEAPSSPSPSPASPADAAPQPARVDEPRRHRTRQEAFEEATRRLLEGGDVTSTIGDPGSGGVGGRKTRKVDPSRRPGADKKTRPVRSKAPARKKSTERVAPTIDLGRVIQLGLVIGFVAMVILSINWVSEQTRGRGTDVSPAAFAHIIKVQDSLLTNNELTLTIPMAEWSRYSREQRQDKVAALVEFVEPMKVARMQLQDTAGKLLARWDGRFITIMD